MLEALSGSTDGSQSYLPYYTVHKLPSLSQLALGLLVVGLGVVATSVLGCWATVRESRCGLGLVSVT